MDATLIVSSIGVGAATIGGAVALYNARKAALWKRAELANSHLKELLSNEELVFACRCLDWNGGTLVVPKTLRPLLQNATLETIRHERAAYVVAMAANLSLQQMDDDVRLQIYRTSSDSLIGWLCSVESAIARGLYTPADIEEARYWLNSLSRVNTMGGFIDAFGYRKPLDSLAQRFALQPFPEATVLSLGGFGSSAPVGMSTGG
jgi:hypothetical protein